MVDTDSIVVYPTEGDALFASSVETRERLMAESAVGRFLL
jgi:hypothetical protein